MLKTALLLIYTLAMLAGCKKMVSLSEIPKADESIKKIDPADEAAMKALDQTKSIKDLDQKDQDKVVDVAYKLIQDPVKFMQSFCHSGALGNENCPELRTDCVGEVEKHKDLLTIDKEKIEKRIKESQYTVKDIVNTMLMLTAILDMSTSMDCGVSEETLRTKAKELIAKAKTLGVDITNDKEIEKIIKIMVTIFIGDEVMGKMSGDDKNNHGGKGGHAATPVGGNKSK